MKWLIHKIGFDIFVLLPMMAITIFYALHNHYWGPFIGMSIGYVASWVMVIGWRSKSR